MKSPQLIVAQIEAKAFVLERFTTLLKQQKEDGEDTQPTKELIIQSLSSIKNLSKELEESVLRYDEIGDL